MTSRLRNLKNVTFPNWLFYWSFYWLFNWPFYWPFFKGDPPVGEEVLYQLYFTFFERYLLFCVMRDQYLKWFLMAFQYSMVPSGVKSATLPPRPPRPPFCASPSAAALSSRRADASSSSSPCRRGEGKVPT